jgi:hypothetical protein
VISKSFEEKLARRAQEALAFWQERDGVSWADILESTKKHNDGELVKEPPHDLVDRIFSDPVMNGNAKLLAFRALQDLAWSGAWRSPDEPAQKDLFI